REAGEDRSCSRARSAHVRDVPIASGRIEREAERAIAGNGGSRAQPSPDRSGRKPEEIGEVRTESAGRIATRDDEHASPDRALASRRAVRERETSDVERRAESGGQRRPLRFEVTGFAAPGDGPAGRVEEDDPPAGTA